MNEMKGKSTSKRRKCVVGLRARRNNRHCDGRVVQGRAVRGKITSNDQEADEDDGDDFEGGFFLERDEEKARKGKTKGEEGVRVVGGWNALRKGVVGATRRVGESGAGEEEERRSDGYLMIIMMRMKMKGKGWFARRKIT